MQHSAMIRNPFGPRTRLILLAGLAGGFTEMLWILLYSGLSSVSAMEVARQITVTALPFLQFSEFAVTIGIGIHFFLSIALAAGFVLFLYRPVARRYGCTGIVVTGTVSLALVWAMNFLVVLPVLNPVFVELMPYAVTGTSKLLFGASMGCILNAAGKTGRTALPDGFHAVHVGT